MVTSPDPPAARATTPDGPNPPPELSPRTRAPHRRARRIAKIIAASVAVLGVVVVAGGYGLVRYYESRLRRVHLATPVGASGHAQNLLLVGSDTRAGVGAGFGSAATIGGQRSDTVILAHLPADGAKPTLVSFPRDSLVRIPAYTDSTGVHHPAQDNKLNTAYGFGGPQLLVDTIQQLTGLRIDHYVEVNFAGFERMVNAVGGVTLCARTTRHDPANGANGGSNDFMTAGVHRNVSGAVALAFVRDRHSFANQDISRIEDQQYFLAQLMKKVLSTGVLLNPVKLTGFLNAATGSLTVDQHLSLTDLKTLADRLRHLDPAHVTFLTIPFTTSNGWATISGTGQSVVLLDHAQDARLFAALRGDNPTSANPTPRLTPAQVRVTVLNATTVPGLAQRAATALHAAGFAVTAVGNVTPTAGTVVRYPPAQAAAARLLATHLATSPRQEQVTGATGLTLVLGPDYTGLRTPATRAATATVIIGGHPATSLSCGA